MRDPAEPTCSAAAASAGLPLGATATPGLRRWLLVEDPSPWGADALRENGLPAPVNHQLRALAGGAPDLRVLLVRGEATGGPRRVFVVHAAPGARGEQVFTVDDPAEILGLPLEAALASPGPAPAAPLFLVCTHGARDRCCALLGMPVFRALSEAAPGRVLRSSHQGGHRYAPTLIVLPWGLQYGRVPVAHAPALVAASAAGEVSDLRWLRGDHPHPEPVQAALAAARARSGVRAVDAHTAALLPDATVEVAGPGGGRFAVQREPFPTPVIGSCGDESPKPAAVWSARLLDAAPAG
jgi:hypothetical protein